MTKTDQNYGERTFEFDGRQIPFNAGQSVAAALMDAGIKSWRTTRKTNTPRGLFCGIGICYDCLVTVDDEANQRACLVPAKPGLILASGPLSPDQAGDNA